MNFLDWLSRPELARLTWALLHFLWQGTLVALLLAAIVRLARIERPSQRYVCSLMALAVMALCPVVTYFAIGQATAAVESAGASESFAPLGEIETSVTAAPSWRDMEPFVRALQPYMLTLWLAGVLALGTRLGCGIAGVLRLSRQRLPLSAELAGRVQRLGRTLRIDALSLVFLSRRVSEALVVGLVRPVVLVPAAWAAEMPPAVLEAIIAHELAHIRRFDLWVNLLQRMVETLLFYHPAVWWVSRRMRQEREMCCDELAVGATGRVAYVEALELVARERLAGVRPALAAGIRGETDMKLLARVRNVLVGPGSESRSLWPAGLLAMLLPLGLWSVTWGVLSPAPAAAVADDDRDDPDDDDDEREGSRDNKRDDDDDDKREGARDNKRDDDDDDDKREGARDKERDDDDDAREAKKERGDRESDRDEGERKEEVKKDPARKERKEGEAPVKKPRKEGEVPVEKKPVKEGAAVKKPMKEGDAPVKKPVKEGDAVKKPMKEGDAPVKKPVKEGDAVKKPMKEGDAPVKKRIVKEGELPRKETKVPANKLKDIEAVKKDRGELDEVMAALKELRGEVERLRDEVNELRGGKIKKGSSDSEPLKKEVDDKQRAVVAELEALTRKLQHEALLRQKEELAHAMEAKERAALDAKRAADANEREAAEREKAELLELHKRKLGEAIKREREEAEIEQRRAAEEKERAILKEREAAERKERERREEERERKEEPK